MVAVDVPTFTRKYSHWLLVAACGVTTSNGQVTSAITYTTATSPCPMRTKRTMIEKNSAIRRLATRAMTIARVQAGLVSLSWESRGDAVWSGEHDAAGSHGARQDDLDLLAADRVARLLRRRRAGGLARRHPRRPGPGRGEFRPRPHDAADPPWWAPAGPPRHTSREFGRGTRAPSNSRCRAVRRRA